MLLSALLLPIAAACDDDGKPSPTATADADAATSTATAGESRDLPSQIGVRAGLPAAEPIGLAARYGKTQGRAATSKPFAGEANVGDKRQFNILRISSAVFEGTEPPEVTTATATLLAKSAHAYFYVDDSLGGDPADVEDAADLFERTTWSRITNVFGEPASPGVDGDPRIIVLQADLGGSVGGYFSGDDGFPKAVRPYSNEAEIVYLDRTFEPGGAAFNVVLAHEFQHLIHERNDTDEEAWVNEGLSEDASLLVGGAGSTINAFSNNPGVQLNHWESDDTAPHYGASSAFFRYLASRLDGEAFFGEIARAGGDGAAGVDEALAAAGSPLRFHDAFADWIVANVLDLDSGPYGNPDRPVGVTADESLAVDQPLRGEARQFGSNYYDIAPEGEYVLRFTGEPSVPVLPVGPPADGPLLWSNAGDEIDTTLTRELDLTDAASPVLTFRLWHDIERWYDWGYVAVSEDGGATWRALAGDRTSADDPLRVALGPGYTGRSGGGKEAVWVDERVNLQPYAGKKVLLRFEYITDGATHGEGWAVDDVAIEQAGFRDDDVSDGGWQRDGWVRIDQTLPQSYVVRVIGARVGGPDVLDVPLDASNRGELRFDGGLYQQIVLAVAGATEGTTRPAPYTLELFRP